MKELVSVVMLLMSLFWGYGQESKSWMKGHQVTPPSPNRGVDHISPIVLHYQGKIYSALNLRTTGNFYSRFAEYNVKNGNLIKEKDLVKQSILYENVEAFFPFINGNSLIIGNGVNSQSGVDHVRHNLLADSSGNELWFGFRDSIYVHCTLSSDTSFYGVFKEGDSLFFTHSDMHGHQLSRLNLETILGKNILDSNLNLKLLGVKTSQNYVYISVRNTISDSVFITRSQRSIVSFDTCSQYHIVGFNGYYPTDSNILFSVDDETDKRKSYLKAFSYGGGFLWGDSYISEKVSRLRNVFVSKNDFIYASVMKSIVDSNNIYTKEDWYTLVYVYDRFGNKIDTKEYRLKNYGVVLDIFELLASGDMYIHFSMYNQLSGSSSSLLAKTDSVGRVLDKTVFGFEPFPVVTHDTTTYNNIVQGNEPLMKIFPNPTSSTLTITTQSQLPQSYNLTDLNGRQILWGEFSHYTQLDVSSLKAGMYFLRVKDVESGKIVSKKIVVQH